MNNLFTFQVNLSPGDVQYANISARKLAQHHLSIPDRLLIVDCCKPQKTKLLDPAKRFPEPAFSERVKKIQSIANELLEEKLYTRVHFLLPGDKLNEVLSKKYLNGVIKETHGAGGTAQMAYWAGIELSHSKYVIHYDGDMMLYQEKGYKWWEEAATLMEKEPKAILAIPRHAPPTELTGELPTYHEGTEIFVKNSYWLHNWFSTRIFLMDKDRLEMHLPLVRGKLKRELLLRKYLKRAFPLDPEILLFKKLGLEHGLRRMILRSHTAWTLHPHTKPEQFIALLPAIYSSIEKGVIPKEQYGREDIELDAWRGLLHV